MFIILTNGTKEFDGQPISIRKDVIVTVYEVDAVRNDETQSRKSTFVFAPPHGTWEVKESVAEVVAMLNAED